MKRVIAGLMWAIIACSCNPQTEIPTGNFPRSIQKNIVQTGFISHPAIKESSGVIRCGYDTNLFWTHNDGTRSVLYAIDRTGKTHAEFVVTGSAIVDWEDIARDENGNIYIADIGNNDAKRNILAVHRIKEPDPAKKSGVIGIERSWRLAFADKPFDCESLFIWKGYGYVISKVFNDAQAEIFRFNLNDTNNPIKLQFVARLPVKSPVTGADISTDGMLLALTAKNGTYSFQINGDVSTAGTAKMNHVKFKNEHIEGCCFVSEGLLVTSEDRGIYLFTHQFFRSPGQSKN